MRKLLIVDDERNIRVGLKAMLERRFPGKYVVLMAQDGEQALELIRQELPVHIVITDIRMPNMDGIALMQELQSLEPKPKLVILSGYDDFKYAKAAIQCEVKQYLLKPIVREELYETMERLEEELSREEAQQGRQEALLATLDEFRTSQLHYVLLHPQLQPDEIREKLQPLELHAFERQYAVAVARYPKGRLYDAEELVRRMHACCHHEQGEQLIHLYDKDGSLVVVSSRKAAELTEQLDSLLDRQPDAVCRIGVSETMCGLELLKAAYEQAVYALKHTFVHGQTACLRFGEIDRKEPQPPIPLDTIRKLANMLGTGRDDDMQALLREVLDIRVVRRYEPGYLEAVSRSLNELVFDYAFHTYGDALLDILKLYKQVGQLYSFDNYAQYYQSVEGLLGRVSTYVQQAKSAHDEHKELSRAVAYIHEHYNKDLNMAMVSNYVSLNYSYFSTAFKAYTGESFVQYVKKVRVEKAQQLLISTDMLVYEIGEQVGFDNAKHFNRVFRELAGVTPMEYRQHRGHGGGTP
ncbi:response regulator [Paenibacillus sp. YYML68]|uniref:response regulator n=1 Tax=Paenibacillus sp. YYML68 TaxID=2909250 RepID=UPI002492919B|nr:response regulator [Paenibacillus sp. YYML68]